MRAYTDADKIAFTCCCTLAVLSTIAYAKWHYWWKTGFSRARMALIAAFAGITLEHTVRRWTALRTSSIPDHVLNWVRISSAAMAATALAYLLINIIVLNIRRVRNPAAAAEQGRRHLKRTPWASQEDIEKLTALWDEMHTQQRKDLLSRVRPAGPGDAEEGLLDQQVIAVRHSRPRPVGEQLAAGGRHVAPDDHVRVGALQPELHRVEHRVAAVDGQRRGLGDVPVRITRRVNEDLHSQPAEPPGAQLIRGLPAAEVSADQGGGAGSLEGDQRITVEDPRLALVRGHRIGEAETSQQAGHIGELGQVTAGSAGDVIHRQIPGWGPGPSRPQSPRWAG